MIGKDWLAVCGLFIDSKVKWSRVPALTLKVFEVPVLPLLIAVNVFPFLYSVMVTSPDQVPFIKLPVTDGLMVPVRSVKFAVSTKLVIVLL